MRELKKEIHVYLDPLSIQVAHAYVATNYHDTETLFGYNPVMHTTLTHYLSFGKGVRLFCHENYKVHEITIGECEGTEREIRAGHDIEKLLLSGEFSWFTP